MIVDPATITAIGGAVAAVGAAFFGGKTGGANSLNGFKEEVRGNFKSVNEKLDVLTRTDGNHEAQLASLTRIVERRCANVEVVEERRNTAQD